MSGLDQRTKARREEPTGTTAVTDSKPPIDAGPWPAIDGELLAEDRPADRRLPVPAFPVELLAQPWRDWAGEAARFSGAPVDYVAQALLASVAATGGRRALVLPTPGWQEPIRLWLAAVGLPSTGKSPALQSVQRLLETLEDARSGSGHAPPRRIVLREGPFARLAETLGRDPRGMVLWRDDVVACLAPPAGARSVRQLEPYRLSIVGTIQPADMERLVRQDADSAARFLYAWPPAQAFRSLPGLELPGDQVLAPLDRLLGAFDALEEWHPMLMDEPAARAFEAFRARLHEEMRRADGVEAAWLGKGGGMVASLAGILVLMSWAAGDAPNLPRIVGRDAVERAVSLWRDYYRPHALALFGREGTSADSRARRVVRWLRASGHDVISREEVRRTALRETVDAREADHVIERLVEAGVLRLRPPVKTDRPGRPAVRWDVSPLLLKQEEGSSLGARHPVGAIFTRSDADARLESRAPGVASRANRENRGNVQTH